MKKKIIGVFAALALTGAVQAQMFGTYNVPGTFPTLAAAISSISAAGVGGPITINVAAGYTETAPLGGYVLGTLTGASSINTVTIRKSGAGANPVLSAYVGTATPASAAQDGVFRFVGADWVTIDGINITDGNTSNPATMEFGYGFFNASATDGCQNNTIINCVVSLKTVNNAAGSGSAMDGSRGIDMVNALNASHTSALTITTATGAHSNNKFYNNLIQTCNVGIALIGFNAASPFTLACTGNDIGGSSAATSNTIINFGGGGTTSGAAAIITLAQHSLNVSYNLINNNNGSGTNHNQVLRGIVLNSANTSHGAITNNTITLRSAGTTQQLAAISNAGGSATNTLSILNNLITGCQYTTATSGVFNAIINSGAPTGLVINSNTISATTHSGTATDVVIETGSPASVTTNSNTILTYTRTGASGAVRFIKTTSPNDWFVSGNLIDGCIWTTNTSTGSMSGIYSLSSAVNVTASNNIIRNMAIPGSGTLEGIREFGVTGVKTIQNNQIYNFTTTASGTVESTFAGISVSTGSVNISGNIIYSLSITGGTTGVVNGILVSGGTSCSISKNKLYDLQSTASTPSVIGINITGGTANSVINNLVGNLNVAAANGANAVIGLNITGGTSAQVHYNTINLSAVSSGTTFGSSALFVTTGVSLNLRNNILVNNNSNAGTGLAVAFRRSSTTLTTYSATSGNNLFYSGTPGSNRLIFADGTNNIQTLALFKAFVFGRDANSVTENPSYQTTVGSSLNFLNISATPSQIEGGASPITGITDDYAGTVRNATTPDIGAWEGAFTPMNACSGAPALGVAITSSSLHCPGVPFIVFPSTTYTESGITYQWQASTTGSTSGFSPISGGTTAILSSPALTAATTWFQLDVNCASAGSVTTTSPVLVTAGVATLAASTNTNFVCTSNSVNLSVPTGSGTVYQWMASTTSSSSGFAPVTGATLATTSQSGTVGNNWFAAVVSCSASSAFSVQSNPVTVTVGLSPTVSVSGPTAQVCITSSIALNATTNGTAFAWSGPNSYAATTLNATVTAPATGSYSFVSALGSCSSVPASVPVLTGGRNFTNNIVASTASLCSAGNLTLSFVNPNDPYTFSSSASLPLLSLTGASTVLTTSNDDTPMAAAANIGFSFNFFGTNYTQYSASPDGWILLGSGVASSQFSNLVTSTTNIPKIYPYWDDLATGTSGYVRTALLGSTPNRTFVVEWYVTIPRNLSGAANSTFQLCLLETTNTIQFRYGAMGPQTAGSASGGLTVSGTNFSSITFASNSTSTVTANDANAGVPTANSGYVFSAPLNPTLLWSPSANLSSSTASLVTGTANTTTTYSLDLNVQGCIQTKTVTITVNSVPVLTTTASSPTLCAGTSVSLTTASTPAASYAWSTGGSGSLIAVTPTVNNINTYTVTATSGACSATQTVSVNRFAGPSITISGPTGICPPDAATLTASGAQSFTWLPSTVSNSVVVSPTVPASYTIVGIDAAGCTSTVVNNLNVNSSLALNGSAPSTVCAGQPANIIINGANTYSWNTGATTNSIAPTPTTTTTYSVVGTSGSCTGSVAITVSAVPYPTVSVTGNMVICSGQTTTLTASGATTYSWTTGSTNNSISVSPATNTTYVLTGFNGVCGTPTTVAITSNTVPVITVTQQSTTICFSTTTTFTANGATSYTWVGGPVSGNYAVTPTVNTTYTVSGTNAANCTSSTTVVQNINPLPTVVISPSSPTICANVPTTFTGSGAATYTWNGGAVTGSTPALSAPTNTVFTVVGASASGCLKTATVSVVVSPVPTVVVTPANVTVCANAPVSLTATGADNYLWYNNTTGSVTIGGSLTNTILTVVGTLSNSGCPATGTVAITTLTLPVITISPATLQACAMSANIFTASGASSYTWSTGPTTSTVVLTPPSSTLYSVTGINPEGCTSSANVTILTYSLPVLSVTPANATVCASVPSNFTVSGAGTYTWNGSSNGNTVALTPVTNTVYTVSGSDTITGCIGTNTFAVATRTAPVLSILPASSQSVCEGGTASFTVSGGVTYTWAPGAFGPVFNANPTSTSVPLTYTVTGKNQQGCTATTTIGALQFPNPVVTGSATSATVCAKETVTLSATGAQTYTWMPYNVASANFTHAPQVTTNYFLQGTDANGCVGVDTVKVVVDKCTGIAKNIARLESVSAYPNPSAGKFVVEVPFDGSKMITVMNAAGQVVSQINTEESSQQVDLSEFAKGIYFITVQNGGETARFKVLVQ